MKNSSDESLPTHILSIDHGTTGTTAFVVALEDAVPEIIGRGYEEFSQYFPKPGWVEHDLSEIWQSVESACQRALIEATSAGSSPLIVDAIGITNQRETLGFWKRDGTPVGKALVWQDRRTSAFCDENKKDEQWLTKKTGLVLDPYFSGTKLLWALENREGLKEGIVSGEILFGTMDTWLLYKLTAGESYCTDVSNASRTLCFDIHKMCWDKKLTDYFGGIAPAHFATVHASASSFGKTKNLKWLANDVEITGVAGDQQAALFGQACFEPGDAKCTYGTGAFILMNTGEKPRVSEHGLLTTVAWQLGDTVTYALEGSAFIAGALVQWLRDEMNLIEKSGDIETLARSVEDNGGVTIVPALTGLGAPYWRAEARGAIFGLTRGTTKGHLARAALEGIAFSVGDLLEAMAADLSASLTRVKVDGGAAVNNLLMQFQADILNCELDRPTLTETTALGAAYLAAVGINRLEQTQITQGWQSEHIFKSAMKADKRVEYRQRWRKAIAKV